MFATPLPPTIPPREGRAAWRRIWHHARALSQDLRLPGAARLALAVSDARRILGHPCPTAAGHAAAWLSTAGEFRRLGRLETARAAVQRARLVRMGVTF